jgi:hypothetical protein
MPDTIPDDIEQQIVQEWLDRPVGKRTEKDIFGFYGYLLKERAHLLKFHAASDKYSIVKDIVKKHL